MGKMRVKTSDLKSGVVTVKVTDLKGLKPRARKSKVSGNVKEYVKKALDREIQDKQDVQTILSTSGGGTSGFVRGFGIDSATPNYGITTANIIPSVSLGLDEDKRVGNYIRPKSLVVNYTLMALPIDKGITEINKNEGMPFYVGVLFYSRKDSKTNNTNSTLKDFGATNLSFTTINDFLLPFNKELYNIHSFKKYKMYPSQKQSVVGTAVELSGIESIPGYVPMVMKSQKLPLPAKLIFDDATALPTNARIYCAIGVFNIDNSTTDRATQIRVKVEMNSVLTYQNA